MVLGIEYSVVKQSGSSGEGSSLIESTMATRKCGLRERVYKVFHYIELELKKNDASFPFFDRPDIIAEWNICDRDGGKLPFEKDARERLTGRFITLNKIQVELILQFPKLDSIAEASEVLSSDIYTSRSISSFDNTYTSTGSPIPLSPIRAGINYFADLESL